LSSAVDGIDVAGTVSSWSCLKSTAGNQFMITRAWHSTGTFDSTAPTNLDNAQKAGIQNTDVYMFPCRGKSATDQVNEMMNDLKTGLAGKPVHVNETFQEQAGLVEARGLQAGMNGRQKPIMSVKNDNVNYDGIDATYGMVWLDMETNPSSGCSWASDSYSSNCDYIEQLAQAVVANGKKCGIYSSEYEWEEVTGSRYACTSVDKYQLWYAHYDNNPSFSDFSSYKFGGWTSPTMKQYAGDATECSTDVDKDYYPS